METTHSRNGSSVDGSYDLSEPKQIPERPNGKGFDRGTKSLRLPMSGRRSVDLRPHSTPATLFWLAANYEHADGVCIPRHLMYKQYCHFCHQNLMSPVNPASFGKIIRQQFQMVKNRRLGTRGYSTYNYHGIGIRATSVYYQQKYSILSDNISRSRMRRGSYEQNTTLRFSVAPLLPEFPSLRDVTLPPNFPSDLLDSFVTMYQAHCQRIYDAVFRANLNEVQEYLSHFWMGVPTHLLGILCTNVVVNAIGICDSVLYRSVSSVLMPTIHKTCPTNLLEMMTKLASLLEVWLHEALAPLPSQLRHLKISLAHQFCRILHRLISLNRMWFSASMMLQDLEVMYQMLVDFRGTDFHIISRESIYNQNDIKAGETTEVITKLLNEFENLLQGRKGMLELLEWLQTVVERFVVRVAHQKQMTVKQVSRNFLLVWVAVGTHILRDMTLSSAQSLGSYHLLGLIFNDYLGHCIDLLLTEDSIQQMKLNMSMDSPMNFDFRYYYQREHEKPQCQQNCKEDLCRKECEQKYHDSRVVSLEYITLSHSTQTEQHRHIELTAAIPSLQPTDHYSHPGQLPGVKLPGRGYNSSRPTYGIAQNSTLVEREYKNPCCNFGIPPGIYQEANTFSTNEQVPVATTSYHTVFTNRYEFDQSH